MQLCIHKTYINQFYNNIYIRPQSCQCVVEIGNNDDGTTDTQIRDNIERFYIDAAGNRTRDSTIEVVEQKWNARLYTRSDSFINQFYNECRRDCECVRHYMHTSFFLLRLYEYYMSYYTMLKKLIYYNGVSMCFSFMTVTRVGQWQFY